MKKITLLTLTTFALVASASAKNLGNKQPVIKNLTNAERVAEYNKTANNPMIGGAEGNKLCATPRAVLQQWADQTKKDPKAYWTMGQSYTFVVDNNVDVVNRFMLPFGALKLQDIPEGIIMAEEMHITKDDPKHGSGLVYFEYNTKQMFDVDTYQFNSDPSTYGQTRVCLTTLDGHAK